MNKKHYILPVIVLILYLLTIWGMVYAESSLSKFYQRHGLLLDEIMQYKDDKAAREQAVERFTQELKFTQTEKTIGELSSGSQDVIDALTFGKEHCSLVWGQTPCKIYTTHLLEVAKEWVIKEEAWSGKPSQNAIAFGTTYTPLDHIIKAITLLIEALLFSWLIGLAYNKRREIRKFYQFTKFRAITAVILFVLVIGPALINDDWYFAAPWIWYILAPPVLLEDLFGGPSDWIGVIIFWPLITLWFYTIATIIDKVRKSK